MNPLPTNIDTNIEVDMGGGITESDRKNSKLFARANDEKKKVN